jgi:hypothetical protein
MGPQPDVLMRLQAALAERYTLERELGRGGMATVYLARRPGDESGAEAPARPRNRVLKGRSTLPVHASASRSSAEPALQSGTATDVTEACGPSRTGLALA